jgi:hypothetical protein
MTFMETKTICPTTTATILACQAIAQSFKENIYELARIRNEWDPDYATSLKIWIDDTIDKYYSNTTGQLNEPKYKSWHEIMIGALKCLGILRASIKVDFKEDKPFLKDFFKNHGYNDFFSDAKNGDHLSMYNLLKTFTSNINDETRKLIEEKGIEKSIIDQILEYSDQINRYRDCFETLESNGGLNKYGQKDMEEIYSTVKDICRISVAYYQYDPITRDKFNFYRVLRNL